MIKKHCRAKPTHLIELDFPHKSKKLKTFNEELAAFWLNPDSKFNQFNENVWKLREYLNKLTKENYLKIKNSILNKFSFNAQLLKQLSKIIFLKATTEQNYINLYVDLCEELFERFNDKDNVEMNFKKLILRKCQREFYKEKYSDNEEDFSSLSLVVYDESEIMYRKKIRVFGNIKLIGELFTRGYVQDKIAR